MSMLFGKQNLLQSILVDLNSPLTLFGSFGWIKKQIKGSIFYTIKVLHYQMTWVSSFIKKNT